LAPSPRGARILGRVDVVVEPIRRVGRASIYRGEAHRTGPDTRWASRCDASFDPPFYEKRRAVKLVFALFSRASFSFPLAAICIFSPSQQKRVGKPLRAHFSRDSSSFPLEAFFPLRFLSQGTRCQAGWCVFSLGHLPPFSLKAVFVFCHSGDNFPLPEAKLGLVFRGSSGPRGSSFYGGFDAPSGTSSDDGLGTRQPILRKLGPLPAQMGGMQLAAWIHLTSRNLSCFHWAQFSQSRPLRVAELL
jgi:hypothetical protein